MAKPRPLPYNKSITINSSIEKLLKARPVTDPRFTLIETNPIGKEFIPATTPSQDLRADEPITSAMIEKTPIGNGLDVFRTSFRFVCEGQNVPSTSDSLIELGHDDPSGCPSTAIRDWPWTLRNDLLRLNSAVSSDDFDLDRIKPLLSAALAESPNDALTWDQVYSAIIESTPPPLPTVSPFQQTPWLRNTSSFANSSKHGKYVDAVLKELGPMYVGLPNFHETFFRGIVGLEAASEAVFNKCV
ncbi:hypothetical protein B0H67DRAFT_551168 [Lasiosphaeris hirsuta]|uniref:Uncharacterized protein n=1 Tax=Lasiosphaeris hirsuta TaxID=260670 RepID=A0AA40E7V3_9PEZI|nr:hypothetical protein B0H67DRAFT_551168 [Lasiosphaeris hirsuta]